ncbi:WhiB family transcriptional regulator [Mycobacterium bourgelatii]|uniref:4Fe-4S Wbl-type domain-containing protein n=1 Tax=Mycobacterium bourgelatii TaxID=1273442 RepID=A0A7I9YP91_MYCBU|nr:WhiB family transcriptional regulator [Mycobacterium bourgelatii]MCV6975332.1 WhiB family transcriptional regulator [Mycobacterium bourgelatii]GFG90437.1 hypothetical protein MBOU_24790 [Mycobacterium bourgelatii]
MTNRQPPKLTATTPWAAQPPAATLAALAAAVADIPPLDGAACRGRPDLFDLDPGAEPEQVEHAQAICRTCPALRRCAEWLAATPPPRRPCGVVAGRLVEPPTLPQPRKTVAAQPRPPRKPQPTLTDRAADWLRAYMAQCGGTAEAVEVKRAAAAAGYGAATVYNAVKRLRLISKRSGQRTVTWTAPPGGEADASASA